MLRGMPHLIKYMPESRDARRLIPDPENEPDFYAISKNYLLPGDGIPIPVDTTNVAHDSMIQAQLSSEVSWLLNQYAAAKQQSLPVAAPMTSTNESVAQSVFAADSSMTMQQEQHQQQQPVNSYNNNEALMAAFRNQLFGSLQQHSQQPMVQEQQPQYDQLAEFLRMQSMH
jgi:hypothetical protein